MKIFEAVKNACEIIKESDTPQLDAEVILSYVLNVERIYLYVNRDKFLEEEALRHYFELVERRKKGEPTQYIVEKQEFMSLDFYVKPGVLIPRGDTEILVEKVLDILKDIENPIIVDIGCGSGAIGISIASYKKDSFIYSLDIMDIPIEVTRINARNNGVEERVEVIKSNLLKELSPKLMGKIDGVVSNPPYIREDEMENLTREVKEHEPHSALFGGSDGLYFYRKITIEALDYIKPGGFLAYEIGYAQRKEVEDILIENNFKDIISLKDYAGFDRVIVGWRK